MKTSNTMKHALYVLEKALSPPSHTQWLADREETMQELREVIKREEAQTVDPVAWMNPITKRFPSQQQQIRHDASARLDELPRCLARHNPAPARRGNREPGRDGLHVAPRHARNAALRRPAIRPKYQNR